jgi:hypothetical protein
MALQVAPLLSPTEISLGFPASKELWLASTAQEWQTVFLQHMSPGSDKYLSISHGLSSVPQIRDEHNIDLAFAATITIYSTWTIAYSSSQLNALIRPPSAARDYQGSFLTSHQNAGVVQLVEQILLALSDWNGLFRPIMALVSERLLLNLHVSFEQVQLFAGKEGEEEARRAFPILQKWADSPDARKAVWHAGQILKAARQCQARELRDFGAICLYHAGLTFWAFGVVRGAGTHKAQGHTQIPLSTSNPGDGIGLWLDGDDSSAIQRFIGLNRGNPVVRGIIDNAVSLCEPKALMELCIHLLRKNTPDSGSVLPLVENLSELMRDLGNAAQSILSGHRRHLKDQQLSMVTKGAVV